MRVLIVSFDRTLTDSLKNALSDHEVFTAKNSEEAIKMIPSDMDVVIYDAISGAISEEDINTLYTKKFSNSKYLILYDELFPVDPNNIIAPKKMLLSRDEDPKVVAQKIFEEPAEEVAVEEQAVVEEPAAEEEKVAEETPREAQAQEEKVTEEAPPPPGKGKVLVVSFDQTLIDTIRNAVGSDLEVVSVKTVRQALDQGKDASVVVFDAISGIIAEKGLTDMSKDDVMAGKPYVILVDDLFPINVDNVPLEKKYPVSRDADPSQIKDLIFRAFAEAGAVAEEPVTEEVSSQEEVEEEAAEEKVEEIIEKEIPQEIPEIEIEQVQEEEEAPALQALERVMEERETYAQEKRGEVEAVKPPQNIEELVREAVARSLSEERVKEALSKALEEKMEDIRTVVSEAIKAKIDQILEEMDIKELIRQTAYKALRDRLDELVT